MSASIGPDTALPHDVLAASGYRLVVELIATPGLDADDYGAWPRVWAFGTDEVWRLLDLDRTVRARQLALLLVTRPDGIRAKDVDHALAGSARASGGVGANARKQLRAALESARAGDLLVVPKRGGRNARPWRLKHATTDAQLALEASVSGDLKTAAALTYDGSGLVYDFPSSEHGVQRFVGVRAAPNTADLQSLEIPGSLIQASRRAVANLRHEVAPPNASAVVASGAQDEDRVASPEDVESLIPSPDAAAAETRVGGKSRRGSRWRRAGAGAAGVLVLAVATAALWPSPDRKATAYGTPIPVAVANLVTAGMNVKEDASPLRLSRRAITFCGQEHCLINGTERRRGQRYDGAVCQVRGERTTNGDDRFSDDDHNPELRTSTRYLGIQLADGTFGFVSEVWLGAKAQGGLGLPTCRG